ncbi:MAG: hypothetical protein HYU64_02475 [Armatimonadetes bacterium]|nr:hypothetical protein [Armatimonadota bacterium]
MSTIRTDFTGTGNILQSKAFPQPAHQREASPLESFHSTGADPEIGALGTRMLALHPEHGEKSDVLAYLGIAVLIGGSMASGLLPPSAMGGGIGTSILIGLTLMMLNQQNNKEAAAGK